MHLGRSWGCFGEVGAISEALLTLSGKANPLKNLQKNLQGLPGEHKKGCVWIVPKLFLWPCPKKKLFLDAFGYCAATS